MLWLLGCWQPPAVVPPTPAQVEASDVLEGSAEEIRPGAPDHEQAAAEGEPAAAEAAGLAGEEGAPEEEGAAEGEGSGELEGAGEAAPPGPPPAVAVKPWQGRTVGSPLTIVDDLGAALQVIRGAPVAVVVLMEGEDRVRVRCEGCLPVVEGWLQKSAVVR